VFSRTGDWPEYLTAIWAGVFDYLAYPPISGELERIIQNAFRESRWQRPLGQSSFSNSRTGVEEP